MDDIPDRKTLALVLAIADVAARGLPMPHGSDTEHTLERERGARINSAIIYADMLLAALAKP